MVRAAAVAHLDLFAHPLHQFGWDVESLGLAVNQNQDLVFGSYRR